MLVSRNYSTFNNHTPLWVYCSLKANATNVVFCHSTTEYTLEMFMEDFPQEGFPQFYNEDGTLKFPESVVNMFIAMANSVITFCKYKGYWRYLVGLFVAHYLTLYGANYGGDSGDILASVKSAQLGDSKIEYDTSSVLSATSAWGAFNATPFGQQLASLLQLLNRGGMYVIG